MSLRAEHDVVDAAAATKPDLATGRATRAARARGAALPQQVRADAVVD